MKSVNIQEIQPRSSYFSVQIPEIKRHNKSLEFNPILNFSHLNLDSYAFEPLKRQLQDHKPQLLRPNKSCFTLVTASQDDIIDTQKTNNNPMTYLNQSIQVFQSEIHKFSYLFADQNLYSKKDIKEQTLNTKNILRNICNAQNQYILFNIQAQKIIQSSIQNIQKFKKWINKLRFHTFQQFQSVWSETKKNKTYIKLYRKLCKKFYIQNAIPYIINSRIKNKQTKLAHIRFLYRFLQGIDNPRNFYYFKLKDNEKINIG